MKEKNLLEVAFDRRNDSTAICSAEEFVSYLNLGEVIIFEKGGNHLLAYKQRNKFKMAWLEEVVPIEILDLRKCYEEMAVSLGAPFVNKGVKIKHRRI